MLASSLSDGYPAGQVTVTHTVLTPRQGKGLEVLIAVSSFSMASVILLLVILAMYAIRASYHKTGDVIFRSHVAGYFISLLVTDLFQAVGSIMNTRWIQNMAVDTGAFCVAQGVIKQAADVGTALCCSLEQIIAVHTFNVLFLNNNIRRSVMYIVLFGGWCFIGIVVGIGPSFLATKDRGPFFGISGYWCWISGSYEAEEIVLDYMLMFASAFFSFSMYMLVFLRLRGNIVTSPGKRISIRTVCKETAWASVQGRETSDFQRQMTSVAKHMLLYPVSSPV
ncbi:hypothetical protein M0805_000188 [Coniferiporia weirii]|nr:hypothetical protein M0805_000188 [Coniferiporia weirii]